MAVAALEAPPVLGYFESFMALTKVLEYLIEPELARGFLLVHQAEKIKSQELLCMKPDLIAYSEAEGVLWICEITTSGFLGKAKGNFHLGGAKKFCESFVKFSILMSKASEVKEKISRYSNDLRILNAQLKCCLVVPKDSCFIKALGWRSQCLGEGMQVEEVALDDHHMDQMIAVLQASQREQQLKKIPRKTGSSIKTIMSQ
jgi:hypothetical protein